MRRALTPKTELGARLLREAEEMPRGVAGLAEVARIDRVTLWRVIAGRVRPSLETLARIALALERPLGEVVAESSVDLAHPGAYARRRDVARVQHAAAT